MALYGIYFNEINKKSCSTKLYTHDQKIKRNQKVEKAMKAN